MLSITFQADTGTDLPDEIEVVIGAPQVGDQALDLASWQPTTWRGSTGTLEPDEDGFVRYLFRPGQATWSVGSCRQHPHCRPSSPTTSRRRPEACVEVGLAGQRLQVEPVAVASQFPGVVPNAPFVVVPVRGLLERQFSIPEAGAHAERGVGQHPRGPVAAAGRGGMGRRAS